MRLYPAGNPSSIIEVGSLPDFVCLIYLVVAVDYCFDHRRTSIHIPFGLRVVYLSTRIAYHGNKTAVNKPVV